MKFSLSEGLALIKRVLADGNLAEDINTSGDISAATVSVDVNTTNPASPDGGAGIYLYNGLSAPVAVTLPAAASHAGKRLVFVNNDATHDVTVAGEILQEDETCEVISDGTAWRVLASSATGV